MWNIWLKHEAYIQRVCLCTAQGSEADAEELTGQLMMRFLEMSREDRQGLRCTKAWFVKVIRNLAVDNTRKRERARGHDLQICQSLHRGAAVDPEALMWRQEIGMAISKALRSLSPKLKAAFVSRYLQDRSYEQIAASLRITSTAARKRCQLARAGVRQVLALLLAERDASRKGLRPLGRGSNPAFRMRAVASAPTGPKAATSVYGLDAKPKHSTVQFN